MEARCAAMDDRGGNTMTREEMVEGLIDKYSDFQMIKDDLKEDSKVLDYKIKVTTAKLSALGVNVEDITIK